MARDSKVTIRILGEDAGATDLAKTVGGAFKNIGRIALGAAGIHGIGSVINKTKTLIKEGGELVQVEKSFNNIADAAGTTGKAVLDAMKDATNGTVPAVDMMKNYNLASQLVSDQFANKLPEAMKPLMKVSQSTGESVGFLMDSLVRGVGRESKMILDNLGIQVDLNKAYETFAEKNGLVADQLSATERKMALMNQVTSKLKENTADMPDASDSATLAFKQWDTAVKDLKDQVGAGLIPLFMPMLRGMQDIVGVASKAGKFFRFVAEGGAVFNSHLRDLPPAIQPVAKFIGNLITKFRDMDSLQGLVSETAQNIGQSFLNMLPPGVREQFFKLRQAVMNVANAFMEHWPQIQSAVQQVVTYFQEVMWPAISNVLQSLMMLVRTILNGIAEFWSNWGSQIITIVKGAFKLIIGAISNAMNLIASVVKAIAQVLQGDFEGAWNTIKNGVVNFASDFVDLFKQFGDDTKDAWSDIWESVSSTVGEKLEPVIEDIKGFFSDVGGSIDNVVDTIKDFIGQIKDMAGSLVDIDIPDWMKPGSPSPLEVSLSNLVKLSKKMSRIDPTAKFGSGGELGAFGSQGTRRGNITYKININIHEASDAEETAREIAKRLRLQGVTFG